MAVASPGASRGRAGAGASRLTGAAGTGAAPFEIACSAASVVPVVGELAARGLAPDDLTVTRPSLEDAFVALTRATGGDDR
jgi:hypothetical protein